MSNSYYGTKLVKSCFAKICMHDILFSELLIFLCMDITCSRYMGTITGIGDLDPVRWANSHWRSVKVIKITLMLQLKKTLAVGLPAPV